MARSPTLVVVCTESKNIAVYTGVYAGTRLFRTVDAFFESRAWSLIQEHAKWAVALLAYALLNRAILAQPGAVPGRGVGLAVTASWITLHLFVVYQVVSSLRDLYDGLREQFRGE